MILYNPKLLNGNHRMVNVKLILRINVFFKKKRINVFNKNRPNLVTYFILAKNNQNSTNRKGHTSYTTAFTVPSNRSRG